MIKQNISQPNSSVYLMIKSFLSTSILIILYIITCLSYSHAQSNKNAIQDFSLKNIDGKMVSLKDYPDAKGFIIVFTCNHCPFAKLYPPRLNALNEKYKPFGIQLIAISSTDTLLYEEDGYEYMVQKAQLEHFNFPYLYDEQQEVAKQFLAQKTPHAFVIWKQKNLWEIKYNGAIDDNGAEEDKVQINYIANAIETLLKGEEIKIKETKSIGCQIHYRKN